MIDRCNANSIYILYGYEENVKIEIRMNEEKIKTTQPKIAQNF
jgi:hypothetical protein